MPDGFLLVGGPWDGRRVPYDARTVQVPILRPITTLPGRVVPFRRTRFIEPGGEVATYHRIGDVYAFDGLVPDGWCDVAISLEALAEGGRVLLRMARQEARLTLAEMSEADGKELGRIVWRMIPPDPAGALKYLCTLRAIVGPRRVRRGLDLRAERQG